MLGKVVAAAAHCLGCLTGPFNGLAQPAAQDLDQREIPEAGGPLMRGFPGAGGLAFGEASGRRVQAPRPQFHYSAGRQYLDPDLRVLAEYLPGQLTHEGLCVPGRGRGRLELAGAAGQRQPDQRRGQPGGDLVVGGQALQDALGDAKRSRARLGPVPGQLRRGLY